MIGLSEAFVCRFLGATAETFGFVVFICDGMPFFLDFWPIIFSFFTASSLAVGRETPRRGWVMQHFRIEFFGAQHY